MRSLLAAVCLGAIAGCGFGNPLKSDASFPTNQPAQIFLESFSGLFPGTRWEFVRPLVQLDPGNGQPAPCVGLYPGGSPGGAWTRHRPLRGRDWRTADGLTITFWARFVEGVSFGAAEIDILTIDGISHGVDGSVAKVEAEGSSATGVDLTFSIQTNTGTVSGTDSLPAGDRWHRYTLVVATSGAAAWTQDNDEKVSTGASLVAPARLGISLRSFSGMEIVVDEILVTRP